DGLDERHRAAATTFLLVDLVDARLHRELVARSGQWPVEHVLLRAVQEPTEVEPDARERRRLLRHPEAPYGEERRRDRRRLGLDVLGVVVEARERVLADLPALDRDRR